MAVPETTLNWLYSVLTSVSFWMLPSSPILTTFQNYTDVNRTYHDATEALSHYPSLAVRTDVYSTQPHAHHRSLVQLTAHDD